MTNTPKKKGKSSMPENPNTWVELLSKVPPEAMAAVLAFVVAALRVVYDGKETRPVRVLLESTLCGFLSLTASHGVAAMGLDFNWSVFIGGAIGFFGSTLVRSLALRFISYKTRD